jgi:hypothetical protein
MLRFVHIKVPGRVWSAIAAVVTAAATLAGAAIPAQAATLGWRPVFSKHYGAAIDYSAYGAVVATSTSNAWMLGGADVSGGNGTTQRALAVHWNGRAWSSTFLLPAPSWIVAASADSASGIWAVTFLGGYVLHWNGAKWLVAKHFSGPSELTGVTALSPTNVWVFGGPGFTSGFGTWHWNGASWQHWTTGIAAGLQRASALTAKNIWAVSGTVAPDDAIAHFNGTSWQQVSATPLAGLQFNDIRALSSTSVWVAAVANGGGGPAYLVHFHGTGWSRIQVPWSGLQVYSPTPDGLGGLWMTGQVTSTGKGYFIHLGAGGTWSAFAANGLPAELAPIPGTHSLWGVGSKRSTTNSSAVIWAYGVV